VLLQLLLEVGALHVLVDQLELAIQVVDFKKLGNVGVVHVLQDKDFVVRVVQR